MASKLAALAQVLFVPNKRAVVPAFLTRPVHRSLKEGGEEEETEPEEEVRVFRAWVGATTKNSSRSSRSTEDEAHVAPINRPVARRALQQFQQDYYRSAVHNHAEGRIGARANNHTTNDDRTRTSQPAVDDPPTMASSAAASARSLSSVSLASQGTASATTATSSSSISNSSSSSSGSASSVFIVEDDDSFFPSSLDGDDYLYFAQ